MPGEYPLFDPPAPKKLQAPLTVSQLSQLIEAVLETTFPAVWVVGEVAEVSRPHSGHVYFTLRDGQSQIRAVLWRSVTTRTRFRLEEGQQVVCHGAIDVYPPRGTYQLDVQKIEPVGLGSLQLAFKQLHQKLAAEGLFDPARKRPLPFFPRRIGFVTSPTGAAIHDFLQIATRRARGLQILVIPARVQGDGAAEEIARGIQLANCLDPPLDVLVVGRGGGSIEDLWSFNEEVVVRAIAASQVPVVSAVGHEIDVTLADLAADVRALTPSEAAERVVPSSQELAERVVALQRRLGAMLRARAAASRRQVEQLERSRILRNPKALIADRAHRLDELDDRALRGVRQRLANAQNQLAALARQAEALSPVATLARGFSVTTTSSGAVLRTASQVTSGDRLVTRLQEGTVESVVTSSN